MDRNIASEMDQLQSDLAKVRDDIVKLSGALLGDTSAGLHQRLDVLQAQFSEIAGKAGAAGRHHVAEAERAIVERPLASVLVAFAVGALLGRILSR